MQQQAAPTNLTQALLSLGSRVDRTLVSQLLSGVPDFGNSLWNRAPQALRDLMQTAFATVCDELGGHTHASCLEAAMVPVDAFIQECRAHERLLTSHSVRAWFNQIITHLTQGRYSGVPRVATAYDLLENTGWLFQQLAGVGPADREAQAAASMFLMSFVTQTMLQDERRFPGAAAQMASFRSQLQRLRFLVLAAVVLAAGLAYRNRRAIGLAGRGLCYVLGAFWRVIKAIFQLTRRLVTRRRRTAPGAAASTTGNSGRGNSGRGNSSGGNSSGGNSGGGNSSGANDSGGNSSGRSSARSSNTTVSGGAPSSSVGSVAALPSAPVLQAAMQELAASQLQPQASCPVAAVGGGGEPQAPGTARSASASAGAGAGAGTGTARSTDAGAGAGGSQARRSGAPPPASTCPEFDATRPCGSRVARKAGAYSRAELERVARACGLAPAWTAAQTMDAICRQLAQQGSNAAEDDAAGSAGGRKQQRSSTRRRGAAAAPRARRRR
jgi:hypothetical protein